MKLHNPVIFGKLISGHFDILMSRYSQVNNSCTSWLCQNSAICSVQKGLDTQITLKHIQAPQICLNTTQIPSETPRGTPRISRQHKMPTDTNRHQQTPADTARLIKKHLAVFPGVCCRLLVSVAVCWCLLLSAGVLCCMEMSVGCLCGCLRASEWYLWMPVVFRCVWELSER